MGSDRVDLGSLGDDLLIEILTRLPLKSFFRNKCVSKSWHGLVSDHQVRKRLRSVVSGVFYQPDPLLKEERRFGLVSDSGFEEANLDFFPFRRCSTLIDCCNGLLLFFSSMQNQLYVANPAMRRFVSLPKPAKASLLSVLAFDPWQSPPEFKVVSFTGWRAEGSEVELFSSRTGEWAQHPLHWGVDTNTMTATMRYVDGALYILGRPGHVVSIDLESMECRKIELPEATKRDGCVTKSGGKLHYAASDGSQMRIWVLNECEWSLKCTVGSGVGVGLSFMAFHPELDVVYLWMDGRLVAYDPKERRMEEICELGSKEKEKAYMIQVWVFPFSRSLEDCLA